MSVARALPAACLPIYWRREGKVANILSGNYCQPRCDEPWTEVLFESNQEGKIVVIVSPLIKLTRVKGAAIDEIGTPEGILNRCVVVVVGARGGSAQGQGHPCSQAANPPTRQPASQSWACQT